MKKSRKSFVIGVDEVGRGPLAGPVYVSAVALPKGIPVSRVFMGDDVSRIPLHNSKAMTLRAREVWDREIKKHAKTGKLHVAYAKISPRQIDEINITQATNRAACRAIASLMKKHDISSASVVLDGGISCMHARKKLFALGVKNFFSVIQGDELHPIVSLASITAKVKRDGVMRKLHKEFPVYGFDEHKGYGTAQHIRAIGKFGLSPHHRVTFCSHFAKKKRTIDK